MPTAPGFAKDPEKAYSWMLNVAHDEAPEEEYAHIMAEAEYLVGTYLIKGFGVERDRNQGLKWLRLAANRYGHQGAIDKLKRLRSLN